MADDRITVDLDLDDDRVKKKTDSFEKHAKKSGESAGKKFAAGFGIAVAALGATLVLTATQAVQASVRQEDAINRMNQSLVSTKRFSQEASQQMQQFAADLQRVTTIGDETTLEMLALAGTFARSNEEARKMVRAAADLAAATGTSLESGIRNLGKSFSGLTGELGESIGEIRTLTAEQLKSGLAVDLVAKKFKGFAESQVNTFSGAMKQASNSFGDLLEDIGKFITSNPVFIKAIKNAGKFLQNLQQPLKDNAQAIRDFVNNGVHFMIDSLIGMVFLIEKSAIALDKLHGWLIRLSAPLQATAGLLRVMFGSEIQTEIERFNATMALASDKINDGELFSGFGAVTTKILEFKQSLIDAEGQAVSSMDGMKSSIGGAVSDVKTDLSGLNSTMRSVFVSGISSSIQGMVNAIAKGQNALQALGKSLLTIAGDLAISIGQFTVATGIAKLALESLPGGATIAAGLGLIALGSVLKAFAGGQPGVGGGETSINNPLPVQPVEPINTAPAEEQVVTDQRRGAEVIINVQGDILDRRETGLALADVIRDTIATNGLELGIA